MDKLAYLLILAAFIWWVYWGTKHQRRRALVNQNRAQTWAEEHGWQFYPANQSLLQDWDIALFQDGTARKIRNCLTTTVVSASGAPRQAVSFEYEYCLKISKTSRTFFSHVIALQLPGRLPGLTISPEGPRAAAAKVFGGQDIDFESEQFNARWRVTGSNRQFAHAVINPQMMEYLLTGGPQGMTYVIAEDNLIMYRTGHQYLPDIEPLVTHLRGVLDRIPAHLWNDFSKKP